MSPFLIHERDYVYFQKPDRSLKSGDIVFFQRKTGQYIMHRIWKIKPEGLYIVGDAQTVIEGPVAEEQVFAVITRVQPEGNAPSADSGKADTAADQQQDKPLVMLVDDSDDFREFMHEMLSDTYRVEEAVNGQDALCIVWLMTQETYC